MSKLLYCRVCEFKTNSNEKWYTHMKSRGHKSKSSASIIKKNADKNKESKVTLKMVYDMLLKLNNDVEELKSEILEIKNGK